MTSPSPEVLERRAVAWWYAVIDAAQSGEALTRVGAQGLRLVRVGRVALIVSDHSALGVGDHFGEIGSTDESLAEVALRHDQIVSGLAELFPALVPIVFGTLVDCDKVAHLDRTTVDQLERLLDRVRDRQEWGVRLLTTTEPAADDRTETASGAAYLVAARDRQRSRREAVSRREEAVAELQRALARVSDDAATLPHRPGHVANLAYLVHRDRAADFRDQVQQAADRLRRCGIDPVVTGPWAPYSFTELGASS